jgi:hypothetical protein
VFVHTLVRSNSQSYFVGLLFTSTNFTHICDVFVLKYCRLKHSAMFLTLSTIPFLSLLSLYYLILCNPITQYQEKVLVTPNEQLQNGGWHNTMTSLKVCDGRVTELTNVLHNITVWLQEHSVPEVAYAFIRRYKN